MSSEKIDLAGMFQLWSYSVTHGTLLLRSVKSLKRDSQIDVLFKNVKAIYLPTLLEGLNVEKIDRSEVDFFEVHLSRSFFDANIFKITSEDVVGYVFAGSAFVCETQDDYYMDSPLLS